MKARMLDLRDLATMDLEKEATSFLRKRGYTWSGRGKGSIDRAQAQFESRMRPTPMQGKSRRRV